MRALIVIATFLCLAAPAAAQYYPQVPPQQQPMPQPQYQQPMPQPQYQQPMPGYQPPPQYNNSAQQPGYYNTNAPPPIPNGPPPMGYGPGWIPVSPDNPAPGTAGGYNPK